MTVIIVARSKSNTGTKEEIIHLSWQRGSEKGSQRMNNWLSREHNSDVPGRGNNIYKDTHASNTIVYLVEMVRELGSSGRAAKNKFGKARRSKTVGSLV